MTLQMHILRSSNMNALIHQIFFHDLLEAHLLSAVPQCCCYAVETQPTTSSVGLHELRNHVHSQKEAKPNR